MSERKRYTLTKTYKAVIQVFAESEEQALREADEIFEFDPDDTSIDWSVSDFAVTEVEDD